MTQNNDLIKFSAIFKSAWLKNFVTKILILVFDTINILLVWLLCCTNVVAIAKLP